MIISHKHKFIFIKTMKTAGTSIEIFLSQHCGEKDAVTPIWPHVEPHRARNYKGHWNPFPEIIDKRGRGIKPLVRNALRGNKFFNHIPASSIKRRIPEEVWDSYFKFCVERNPWDKTLSHYHMINDHSGGTVSFDAYLENGQFCKNYPRYCDASGQLMVDRIVKYESLIDELGHIFRTMGIPFADSLDVNAKSEHRKDRSAYQDVFSIKQKDVIERSFAKEIEMHGYVF